MADLEFLKPGASTPKVERQPIFLVNFPENVGVCIPGGCLVSGNEQDIEFSTNPFENHIAFAFPFCRCK